MNQKLINQIKRTNTKFLVSSKAEQRVQIAKDVIKQLETGFFNPISSGYCIFPKGLSGELSQELKTISNCKVCAKGGLFVALIARKDKYELVGQRSIDDREIDNYLSQNFSLSQLNLIEEAFENWDNIRDFYPDQNHKERMILIMKNIIKNKGLYRPKKDQDYTPLEWF